MLKISRQDRVALLTIDRPQRRNALGSELVAQLRAALAEPDHDPAIGAVVLAGSPPGFCAGSDLKELGAMNMREMCVHEADTAAFARSIGLLSKPVIAAVEGFALGGGFALATSCDLVVTTPSCRWHMPEVTIGWIPPWGLEFLVARCGPVAARRLTWGSEPLDGAEAHRLGVADYLVADASATAEAVVLARRIAALPAPAVAATKRYFTHAIAPGAELRDAEATLLFAENCTHEVAKATLKKFGVKA